MSLTTATFPRGVPTPSVRAIKHMLQRSVHCLQRADAQEVIETCDLSDQEALAVCERG